MTLVISICNLNESFISSPTVICIYVPNSGGFLCDPTNFVKYSWHDYYYPHSVTSFKINILRTNNPMHTWGFDNFHCNIYHLGDDLEITTGIANVIIKVDIRFILNVWNNLFVL